MCFHTLSQLEPQYNPSDQPSGQQTVIPIVRGLAGNCKIRSCKQKRHSAKAEWRRYLNQAAVDKPLLSYPSLNWLVLAGTGNLAG